MKRLVFLVVCVSTVIALATQGCGLIAGVGGYSGFTVVDGVPADAAHEATTDAADSSLPEAGDAETGADAACVPDAQADCLGKCGELLGRCSIVRSCGGCPLGESCGASGSANVCGVGPGCVGNCTDPATKACGASDGCDSVCVFGYCGTGLSCSGGLCKCGPATCSGCCGADGQCHTGVGGPSECGTGGAACTPAPPNGICDQSCGSNGQVCCTSDPQCGGKHLSCGGGGQPGVCGCTPNCGLAGDGGVDGGAAYPACGADDGCGGTCQSGVNGCPAFGQRCVTGGVCACDPNVCPGCCNGSTCEMDGGQALCGLAGALCVNCQADGGTGICNMTCGNTCGGKNQPCCPGASGCVAPLSCDGDSGTCTCTPDCTHKACGEGDGCGGACSGGSCPLSTQTCSATLETCTCDATSCPTGCCVAGVCINGNQGNSALCGIGGAQCVACAAGQVCSGGLCTLPDDAGD